MNLLLPLLLVVLAAAGGYLTAALRLKAVSEKKTDALQKRCDELLARLGEEQSRLAAVQARYEARQEDLQRHEAALRTEFQNFAREQSRRQGEELRTLNREEMDRLLAPLGQNIREFRDKFASTREGLEKQIESLLRETGRVSDEANGLARALRGESKTQGNWGEGILTNLLSASGLKEGTDYRLQEAVTDGEGRRRLPDCVVNLPEGKCLVIDSKVSLTAYIDYVNADSEEERAAALSRHLESVRAHFKELERKDYTRLVRGAVGYVLMFVPNEAAYVAAVEADSHLISDAYARHIIVVNPTNLLMALQLALNLWQAERRKQNVEDIYRSAEALYKKFTTFAASYVDVGRRIEQLQAGYETSRRQLCTGRGNIVSRLERWREKGLDTTARLPESLVFEDEEAAPSPLPEKEKESAGGDAS